MTGIPSRRSGRSAYTLVEVMISASVSLLVTGGALWLLVAGVRSSTLATSGAVNDLTQWGIASRLWVDARIANGITIYEGYTTAKVERWLRRVVNDGGNFMVFSLSSQESNSVLASYSKITGYYFTPTANTTPATGTIYRFDYTVSSADQSSNKPLDDILKDNRTAIMASAKVVATNITTFMTTNVVSGNTTTTVPTVFLCRAAGTVATLACSVSTGVVSQKTFQQKVIEATFFIRG